MSDSGPLGLLFISPLKPLNQIQRNLTGSKISTSSTKFVFSGWSEKQDGRPASHWAMAETFLVHLSRRLKCTIVIMRCPSSVRPSVRPSVIVNFSHFQLLLWNRWTEFNETWQEARSQRPLQSLCFLGRSEKQDGRPGLWLAETFSTSPLKPLNGIQRNLTGSKISTSSIKFVFFGPIGKTRWPPWPLIGWDIFDFSSETAERNSTKLDRKQDFNVLYQVCVFRTDRKNKMAALASDWLRRFWLLLWNRWTEFNETWQEARSQCILPSLCFSGRSEKQDGRPGLWLAEIFSTSPLKPLNGIQRNLTGSKISTSSTKFLFFQADQKNKMVTLVSDWLRHFRLLFWNRWTEFNETWQEARSQHPLPSLCFSGRSKKQDGRPGLWLAEIFSTSPLKPLNGIQRNLTGSKISTSSTKFVFFGPIGKTRWLPWSLIGWDIFDFSSETAERNSTKLDRKQDLNVLDHVCVFWADRKNKMAAWPLIGWDIFYFSSETAERNWTKLDRKQDLNVLYQVCVFRADWKNKMPPWPLRQKGGTLNSGARYVALWASCLLLHWNGLTEFKETWQEARSQVNVLYQVRVFQADWKKQDGCPCLWLAATFSIFSLILLNGIQGNLTGGKIPTSCTKFV